MSRFPFLLLTALPLAIGCTAPGAESAAETDDAITSNAGKVLELRFDGEVLAAKDAATRPTIIGQLQYLQGILTADTGANAQVGLARLSNVRETVDGDTKTIRYSAVVPVIWPKNTTAPSTYALPLPRDAREFDRFNETYDGKCGTNEYGRESFWHDYNPKSSSCRLVDGDVSRASAALAASPSATKDKYPEYDRVWEDDRLDVVGVFGIISSFNESDDGVREMNTMLSAAERGLTGKKKEDLTPASGSVLRATRLSGKITVSGKTRTLNVTAILVHSVASAGSDFDALYGPATENADFVYYGGHSGLGSNINSLAARAKVKKDKYQLLYLNGCQTFAYLGTAWHDKKRDANGQARDPQGTKDLDIFATALPAYDDNGRSMLAIYEALATNRTRSFNDLLNEVPSRHLPAVFGEEDNVFRP